MMITNLSLLILMYSALLVFAKPTKKGQLAQVITKCTVANTVALTFDDGPWMYSHTVVDALDAAGVKGTFFFNGRNFGCIYDAEQTKRVQYAYDRGHQVASHTWAHRDLTTLTSDQINDEMLKLDQALQRIIGVTPAFMRPPFGKYNDVVRQVLHARGQTLVMWDFDSRDSASSTPQQSIALYRELANRHPNTALCLNHDVHQTTADQVLPSAIDILKKAGYKLVTLSECLGLPAYNEIGKPGTHDDSWRC